MILIINNFIHEMLWNNNELFILMYVNLEAELHTKFQITLKIAEYWKGQDLFSCPVCLHFFEIAIYLWLGSIGDTTVLVCFSE